MLLAASPCESKVGDRASLHELSESETDAAGRCGGGLVEQTWPDMSFHAIFRSQAGAFHGELVVVASILRSFSLQAGALNRTTAAATLNSPEGLG